MNQLTRSLITIQILISLLASAQLHNNNSNKRQKQDNVVAEMQVLCHSDAIELQVSTNTPFNGMLYAKEAPSSNKCVSEFHSSTNMTFRLPLKSCGTMFAEVDDGIEYFNTVVVQPHMRLMTNQGKGYHIRCKYQTRERTIANTHFNVSAAFHMQNGPQPSTTPLLATASMPSCVMKIFRSSQGDIAETVKIGDKLIMIIEIDQQDMYGMKVTNCVVRDGLNLAEQQLLNEQGCSLDDQIMPKFNYTNNFTKATVSFPAHKFPHTSSVYYQCNVRLCINNGNCDQADCSSSNANNERPSAGAANLVSSAPPASSGISPSPGGPRRKRFVGLHHNHHHQQLQRPGDTLQSQKSELSVATVPASSELGARTQRPTRNSEQQEQQMSFDVYSGLYVSDADAGEVPGNEPSGQQNQANLSGDLTPSSSSSFPADAASPPSTIVNCMNWARAGLLVVVASCASVGLVLLLACQVGLVGGASDEAEFVASRTGSAAHSTYLSSATSPYLLTQVTKPRRSFAPSNQQRTGQQLYQSPRA